MFAVIKTGGKQYRVVENDTILVEKLAGEPGDTVELKDVLILGEQGKAPTVGAPVVAEAAVFAEVVDQTRGEKVVIFKKRRRQGYRRTRGHRQDLTVLRIIGISADGSKPAVTKKAAPKKAAPASDEAVEAAPEAEAKKPAAKKAAPKKAADSETKKKAPAKKAAPKKSKE